MRVPSRLFEQLGAGREPLGRKPQRWLPAQVSSVDRSLADKPMGVAVLLMELSHTRALIISHVVYDALH